MASVHRQSFAKLTRLTESLLNHSFGRLAINQEEPLVMPPISKHSAKLTCALLAGLSLPFTAPTLFQQTDYANAQSQSVTFSDVSADYWAADYIEGLAQLNIVSGFNDGTFKPNDPITRAEFAAILHQAFLQQQTTTAQTFVDVPADYWAADDIYAARAGGFLAGYPGNRFAPNINIPKGEVLVSLANGLEYTAASTAVLSAYEDADAIAAYARPSIAAATEANLVVNYPYSQQLSPFIPATRADVAAYVYQALVTEGRAEPLAVEAERRWQNAPVAIISSAVEQMSISNSGQQIATIPIGGNKIQVWNAQTGVLLKEIPADNNRLNSVAISQDGTKVAAVDHNSPDNTIELSVWSVETGDRLWQTSLGSAQNQPPHTDRIVEPSAELAFSLNDSQIVAQANLSQENAQISVHDAATGDTLQSLNLSDYEQDPNTKLNLSDLTLSADGQFLTTLIHVSSWLSTPELPQKLMNLWQRDDSGRFERAYGWMLSPAGSNGESFGDAVFTHSGFLSVLTGGPIGGWNQLDMLNPQTGMGPMSITVPADRTDAFTRLSPDGEYYFVRGDVAGSRLVNIQTGEIQNWEGDKQDTEAVFSRNGAYLAIANPENIRIFSKSL